MRGKQVDRHCQPDQCPSRKRKATANILPAWKPGWRKENLKFHPCKPGVEIVAADIPHVLLGLGQGAHQNNKNAEGKERYRQTKGSERSDKRFENILDLGARITAAFFRSPGYLCHQFPLG